MTKQRQISYMTVLSRLLKLTLVALKEERRQYMTKLGEKARAERRRIRSWSDRRRNDQLQGNTRRR